MPGGSGTLPRVRALGRVRSNPKLAVAVACGLLLLIAWIGWAIYVTGDRGSRAGLGVILAWPALVGALALISLPFVAGYLLLRDSPSEDPGDVTPAAVTAPAEAESPHGVKAEEGEPAKG
jgi:hypothetical protein